MSYESTESPECSNAAVRSTELLSAILFEIGASQFLQRFLDDDQEDDSIPLLSRWKPERITSKYGLPLPIASEFLGKCREQTGFRRIGVSTGDSSPMAYAASPASSSPTASAVARCLNDASLLRQLKLETVCELGKGGFGTVYKCKDAVQRRFVAVKLVNDPHNALAAIREGQKLLRAKHKNIVLMHRVHDLDPILGSGSCALEMEVVEGGDLSQHLEAARRRPELRLPRNAVLRFSRQLLEALDFLHGAMKWLHGDIKPQNLLLQCPPLPADGSAVDYSDAEIKLADFGLAKVMDQDTSSASFMLTNASTKAGVVKGTVWYERPFLPSAPPFFIVFKAPTGISLPRRYRAHQAATNARIQTTYGAPAWSLWRWTLASLCSSS
jgi:hypothetical protein